MTKKGQVSYGNVPSLVIVAVTIAIVLGVGATILDGIQATQEVDGFAYNTTQDGLEGLDDLSGLNLLAAFSYNSIDIK